MTFNCRLETPCGWCEKFDKECKEVCGTPKNDRFKPQMNPPQQFYISSSTVKERPLKNQTIK